MSHDQNTSSTESGDLLCQDKRPRRRRDERGLPSDDAIRQLARTYLEHQHRQWPELAASEELPPTTEDSIAELAVQFKRRFLDKQTTVYNPRATVKPWEELGACYLRYSCDNSNPRSLDQQLRLQLERARQNAHFIPWEYVFADAAVTGTTAGRHGYELAKKTLRSEDCSVGTLYIDEIGRASRDMIESLSLGRLIDRHGRRLIGISDGFDSQSQMAKMQLSIFAALQEWFIDQLRAKVNRGMDDAFYCGTNTGLPAIGYKLAPAVDRDEKPVIGQNGEQLNMLVVDDDAAEYVRRAFALYGERNRTLSSIARLFNRLKVGGSQSWNGSRVRQVLTRWRYIGIEVYRTKRQWIDPDTGDVITEPRPRSEWLVRRARHLQIASRALWKKVQQRLADSRKAYSPESADCKHRSEVNPTVLVRPLCGCCRKPLWLGRSGKYSSFTSSFTCVNGRDGINGCTFRGYKSVRIVENCVLQHVKEHVLTVERIEDLVRQANTYLAEEAAKPKADIEPLKAEIKQAKARRDHLAKLLDREGTQDLDALVARLRGHERRLKELNRQLHDARTQNFVPAPISRLDVEQILCDLRVLLNQDVAQAAHVLRELTGPVVVRQEKEAGKKTWIAEFSVNLVPIIAKLTASRGCPTKRSWEYGPRTTPS